MYYILLLCELNVEILQNVIRPKKIDWLLSEICMFKVYSKQAPIKKVGNATQIK